jgi:HPt (histidine-containing phosphotransfer) domain-containing protein
MSIHIPGIDVEIGIQNTGSEELLEELLGDVYNLMDEKTDQVEKSLTQGNIKNFTTEVHSLKTTCRIIGAVDLGEDFYTLEKLGKAEDIAQIKLLTPMVLDAFKALKPYLKPYADGTEMPQKNFDKTEITALLNTLISALNDYLLTTVEETTKELFSYRFEDALFQRIAELNKLVSHLDYAEAKELAAQIRDSL